MKADEPPEHDDTPDSGFTGKIVNISGVRLSFDPADSECGVFFWNGGGREAAIRAVRIRASVPHGWMPKYPKDLPARRVQHGSPYPSDEQGRADRNLRQKNKGRDALTRHYL